MTPAELVPVIAPVVVLLAALGGALITRSATNRSATLVANAAERSAERAATTAERNAKHAADASWRAAHAEAQYAAVLDFLKDTQSADVSGATLNLRFRAPSPEILAAALRIQAVNHILARPALKTPGAAELIHLKRLAAEEEAEEELNEDAGRPPESICREALRHVLQFREQQEEALNAGEPAPDPARLVEALTLGWQSGPLGVLSEDQARRVLAPAADRRVATAELERLQKERTETHKRARTEHKELTDRISALMNEWGAAPPEEPTVI